MTAVEALRNAAGEQELFRGLVECSQDAILIKTLDGQVTFWNAAAQRLYGYRAQEVVGRHIGLLVPPDLKDEEAELLGRIGRGERIEHYETRRVTGDGRILDVDVSLWPIRTRQGVIEAACSITRDISERKRSEARIDELAVVVESAQDAILIKTLDGQVTFWNAAAQRLYGYRAQEVVGRHIGMLIPPDLKDEEAELLGRIGRGERIEHYETRRVTGDGRILDVDVTLWPIRNRNGVITGACSTMRDITERKKAERELAELYAQQRHIALALRLMGASEQIPGARAATRYLPSTQGQGVGGDWLDLVDLGAGRVGVLIGDVMGRGLDAAVVMGQLRSAARALALAGTPPCELIQTLDTFTRGLPEQFVTCTYLEADPALGEVTACSAGHLPVWLVEPDGTVGELPVPTGIPLGVGGVPHQQVRLPLRAGTTLALYTDGLVEKPHNDIDAQLDLLAATLREVFAAKPDLEEAADRVLQTMLPDTATYSDDVTLLLVGFPAAPLDTAEMRLAGRPSSVPEGRRFVRRTLRSWGLSEFADTVLLLASELLTNAVCHATGQLTLRVWHSARELGVEVSDGSTPRPRARLADNAEENGRGLMLVEALADAWGTRPGLAGKTVWCTLLTAPARAVGAPSHDPAGLSG
ncbi:MEKHLA domain-containing protein [Streptomyces albofaciens JCM 4342]|uniref:SpoIIE family protein phosphatase n=1 Tax=Streptomyces albofaciens TaxID=66866 RepID=UPI0012386CAE|nr:PAS domain S-box protein [Streptomyces albofaciens]KAA6212204.1 MEKHLA domain-containing protein [Streptomyces albofaciens JCM 4342]